MDYWILFAGGIGIGIIGVLLGGGLFLSVPFIQMLFPGLSYGMMLGNLKTGSLFRSLASTFATWKKIEFKALWELIPVFVLSSALGTFGIAHLDQRYTIVVILLSIVFSELAPYFAGRINRKTRVFFAILLGLYLGLFGAGVSLLLVALLRTYFPSASDIVKVKIQARFLELMGTFFVVIIHFLVGNILWPLWGVWSLGMLVGGFMGGFILNHTTKVSARWQKIYLRVIYIVALLPFMWKFFN